MSNYQERFLKVLSQNSLSDISKATGINYHTLRSYALKRSNPSIDNLLKIADAYAISLDWLAGRPGVTREYGDRHMNEQVVASDREATTGLVQIPLYEVEAGAGRDKLVEGEKIKSWLWISREFANRFGRPNLSVIKVRGDSMVPFIDPGDLVVLNTADKTRGAGVRLVRLDDSLTIKRCEPLPKQAVRLTSDNPGYEAYTAQKSEFEIVGAVVMVFKIME